MKSVLVMPLLLAGSICVSLDAGESFIVKDGRPNAEIITDKEPPRTTRLAAHELQAYVEKISGAKLPIVTEPNPRVAVKIYVGQSPHTEELKITADGLKYGAYRIASGDNYLNGLRNKSKQLHQKRGPVPQLRLVRDSTNIVIDGKLDEEAWQQCPTSSTGQLRELQTARQPVFGTSFKTAWGGGNLYFAIRCEERKGEKLNIATTRKEDQPTWYGDVVEILLATESHSYYQIAVNPSGALIDLDRAAPKSGWFGWDSKAEVATRVADDHWTVEIRIPVVQDKNDPLHQVVGHKPTQSLPWHINVCRQRIRDNGSEHSAFAPTGKAGFHVPMKFAHFYAGRSHRFESDPTVTDYLIADRAASELMRKREFNKALAAYIDLAAGRVTDFQKSAALEQAALCARSLKNYDRAAELADQAPIEAVAKTIRMQNLLAQHKSAELVEQFGDEDIDAWPFRQAGAAFFARGRAFCEIGNGKAAEDDLQKSLEFTSDSRTRLDIWLVLGGNRENNLKDDTAALAAYQQIAGADRNNGIATYFRGLQCAARMLRAAGKFDDSLATLQKIDVTRLRGYWYGSMLLALGESLKAAGRNDEAIAVYQKVLAEESVVPQHRGAAQLMIKAMQAKD